MSVYLMAFGRFMSLGRRYSGEKKSTTYYVQNYNFLLQNTSKNYA